MLVLPVQYYREINVKHKLSFLINYPKKIKTDIKIIGHDLADLSQLGLFKNKYMFLQ